MDKENLCNTDFNSNFCFPDEFPYGFDSFGSSSALSSPVESVVGSTEMESSEDDDFLVGLTRRLTRKLVVEPNKKKWVVAGSPKSTLSGIGSWSLSSNGSSNSETSPPTTPFWAKVDPCDLILPAGGPVLRLKMNNEENKSCNYQERGLLGPAWNQNPDTVGKNQSNGFSSSKSFGQDVSQLNQQVQGGWQDELHLHHQHLQQHQIQNRGRNVQPLGLPLGLPQSAWPPLRVQPNQHMHQHHQQSQVTSGKRAAGTGVFLPRRYTIPSDRKKKSACTTVLVPAKVVQPLDLNLQDSDAWLARNGILVKQKGNLGAASVLKNKEICLPQEWIY